MGYTAGASISTEGHIYVWGINCCGMLGLASTVTSYVACTPTNMCSQVGTAWGRRDSTSGWLGTIKNSYVAVKRGAIRIASDNMNEYCPNSEGL
jgi:hypothetical protein